MLFARITEWIDEQTGAITAFRRFLYRRLPAGTGWFHVFGGVAVILFVIDVVTGIVLMFYYSPSPDHAYQSVRYITETLPYGSLIRGLHYRCTDALAVMIGLHMLRTFLWGAYKRPRQMIWVSGVGLLLLTMAFTFTGGLLAWDQNSYWATLIRTSIPSSFPLIGPYITRIMRGGTELGAISLTHFYTIHTVVLPAVMGLLVIFHVAQTVLKNVTAPWTPVENEDVQHPIVFHPDQTSRIVIAAMAVVAICWTYAVTKPTPLGQLANPTSTYQAHTDWYFMYLFQLAHYFSGQWEFIGAMIIPGIVVLGLILLPYVDRNPQRVLGARYFGVAVMVVVLISVSILGVLGLHHSPKPPELNMAQKRGEKLFLDLRCQACHGINGGGGSGGPDLGAGGKRDPQLLREFILDPAKTHPRSIMPATKLPATELDDLVTYVMTLGPTSHMPVVPEIGPRKPDSHMSQNWMLQHKFDVRKDPQLCQSCHKPQYCQECHQKRLPDSHLQDWLPAHGGAARQGGDFCRVCHAQTFCDACHVKLMHGPNWFNVHGKEGLQYAKTCMQCHDDKNCLHCHRTQMPHPADWVGPPHREAARQNPALCANCHQQTFCIDCHSNHKPATHTSSWRRTHAQVAAQQREVCAACHGVNGGCLKCHGVEMPHPADFSLSHGTLARQKPSACRQCHSHSDFCAKCHQ